MPVRARRPNEVWLIDLTEMRGLFRLKASTVAVVLDAHARLPVAAQIFGLEIRARHRARDSDGRWNPIDDHRRGGMREVVDGIGGHRVEGQRALVPNSNAAR